MPGTAMLAAFSRDWIGGDIRELREVAERLYSYLPQLQDLVDRLSMTSENLTHGRPGGWQGPAADEFAGTWNRQAAAARVLEEYVSTAARTIEWLAVELSRIESALENEASLVARDGVHIGGDGTVIGYAGPVGLLTAFEYRTLFQRAQDDAEQARTVAAEQLSRLYQRVLRPSPARC